MSWSNEGHGRRGRVIVKEPETDGDVVTVAAVVHGDGSIEVEQAPFLAVVEDEDVQLRPEPAVMAHHI